MPTKPPVPKAVNMPAAEEERRNRRSRHWCRTCCCVICILEAVTAVLLLAAAGVFYLLLEPRLPVFHLRSVQTPRFNVTVEGDRTYLDSQAVVRVEAENPNDKLTFYYERSELRLVVAAPSESESESEGKTELGSASVSGFTQGRKKRAVLQFATPPKKSLVGDAVGTGLRSDYRSKALGVRSEVRTRLGLGVGGWRIAGAVAMEVVCDTTLKKLDRGAMPGCTVNFLNL